MDNTVSWCVTDIFEYVIKYHNNTISYSKDMTLKPTGKSTQKVDCVACNDVTTRLNAGFISHH